MHWIQTWKYCTWGWFLMVEPPHLLKPKTESYLCFRNVSVILADEMGLGKTIQSMSFLYCLFEKYQLHG